MDILVTTSYPTQGSIHGKGTVGIASYTKNTFIHLQKIVPDLHVTILAEILDKKTSYSEDQVDIKRVWKRNNIFSLLNLFWSLFSAKESQIIISFEVYMFGSSFLAGLFLLLLPLLKLRGKTVTLILHQVPEDISDAESGSLRAYLFPYLKFVLYRLLINASQTIITFEEALRKPLLPAKHVVVIPHAVEPVTILPQSEARKKLGWTNNHTYLLAFGFLSPYKGPDALLDIWKETDDTHLILAGGANPNHADNPSYQTYVKHVKDTANNLHVPITDFVPEEDIPLYFSACDAVILPYRIFFSSSGPLSLAFAYEKPIILSPPLLKYFDTEDFSQALKKTHLTKQDFLFEFDSQSVQTALVKLKEKQTKLVTFSRDMKNQRDWNHISKAYAQVILNNE